MPVYEHNWLMKQGNIPRPEVVRDAHHRLVAELQRVSDVLTLPFPEQFNTDNLYKHDFIFVRDSYISVGKRHVIISNFSARGRQDEAGYMEKYMTALGLTVSTVSPDAYAEGGEFYLLPKDNLMFAGVMRSNQKGVEEVARISGIRNVCVVKNPAFHLDTNFTIVKDSHDHCVAVIACLSVIENRAEVIDFCRKHTIEVIDALPIDGMGAPDEPGTFAVNCLAFPGILVGCAKFQTPHIEETIHSMGIRHIVVPLYDLKFSAGAVHCLTNELVL